MLEKSLIGKKIRWKMQMADTFENKKDKATLKAEKRAAIKAARDAAKKAAKRTCRRIPTVLN